MAGFAKVIIGGRIATQDIVNILWYRSDDWLPFSDTDIVAHLDVLTQEVITNFWPVIQPGLPSAYTLASVGAVAYNNLLVEAAPGLFVRTVNENGTSSDSAFDTYGHTAPIGLLCGQQVQLNGIGLSKRNRGSFSFGPMSNSVVANDGTIDPGFMGFLGEVGDQLMASMLDIFEAVSFIPIRLHHARTLGVPSGLTYSDVIGYHLPSRAGFRRSRVGGG